MFIDKFVTCLTFPLSSIKVSGVFCHAKLFSGVIRYPADDIFSCDFSIHNAKLLMKTHEKRTSHDSIL